MTPDKSINPGKIKSFKYLINCIEDKHHIFSNKPKYALLIGAGCSYKSNIPLGGDVIDICQKLSYLKNEVEGASGLVKNFLQRGDILYLNNLFDEQGYTGILKDYIPQRHQVLKQKVLADRKIEEAKLKEFIEDALWDDYEECLTADAQYGFWMDEFDNSPRERQRLIEAMIDRKDPGGAYILLSYMIERKVFSNILTTNFDDLINDALIYFTSTKCRFYADDEISQFISVYSDQPNIIKLHGDYRFANMKNTSKETVQLSKNLEIKIGELLQNFNLVVVGYNGADHSIMNALNKVKANSKYELIWCGMNENDVHWRVAHLINNTDNSYFVKIEGFDEMMGQLYPHFKKIDPGNGDPGAPESSKNIPPSPGQRELKSQDSTISWEPPNLVEKAKERQKIVDALLQRFKTDFNESSVPEASKAQFNIDDLFSKAYNEKDYDKAIELYTQVISLDPLNAPAYNNRGNAYYNRGKWDEAIVDFNKAIELKPDYAMAYDNRGISYIAKRMYDEAIPDHNKAIELNPNDANAYINRGIAYHNKRMYDKAIADYTKAIENNPTALLAHANRALSYLDTKMYDAAIADLTKEIELNPLDAIAFSDRGLAYYNKKMYTEAIADYSKAIALNPAEPNFYLGRGNVYQDMKKSNLEKNDDLYDLAIADYNKAIELSSSNANAYISRGSAYHNKGMFAEAIEDYTKGISINPASILAYSNRGLAYYDTKLYDKAIEDYNTSIEIDPSDPGAAGAANGIANSYRQLKKEDQGIAYINNALNQYGHDPMLLGTLAETYAQKGDDQNFYYYVEEALRQGCPIWDFVEDPVYAKYKNEVKFMNLVAKYKK